MLSIALTFLLGIIVGAGLAVFWAVRSSRELEEIERVARDINRRDGSARAKRAPVLTSGS